MGKVANTIVFDRNSGFLNIARPVGTKKVRRKTYTGRYAISITFGSGIASFLKKPKTRYLKKKVSAIRAADCATKAVCERSRNTATGFHFFCTESWRIDPVQESNITDFIMRIHYTKCNRVRPEKTPNQAYFQDLRTSLRQAIQPDSSPANCPPLFGRSDHLHPITKYQPH